MSTVANCEKWRLNKKVNPETGESMQPGTQSYQKYDLKCDDLAKCQMWTRNKFVDPRTNQPLEEHSALFKQWDQKCSNLLPDCQAWLRNRAVHPATNKPIDADSPMYKRLEKECDQEAFRSRQRLEARAATAFPAEEREMALRRFHSDKVRRDFKDLQNAKSTLLDKNELESSKNFFKQLLQTDGLTEQVAVERLELRVASVDHTYNDTLDALKTRLSEDLTIDELAAFAREFWSQDTIPLNVFYNRYFNVIRPSRRNTRLPDADGPQAHSADEDEDSRLARLTRAIKLSAEQRMRVRRQTVLRPPEWETGGVGVVNEPPIPRPKAPDQKAAAEKIYFETMPDLSKQDCEFLYKKMPWVKDVITSIFIKPLNDASRTLVDLDRYLEHAGSKYYVPLESYYAIQCYSTKLQSGDELTVLKHDEKYVMSVALSTTTKGLILQNEDMLNAEIDYIKIWNTNKHNQIDGFKTRLPNEEMLLLASYELADALSTAIGVDTVPVAYRSPQGEFIKTVIKTIERMSDSGDAFVRLLTNIVVFLRLEVSFLAQSAFVRKLQKKIYLPGTLPFLTQEEKLPEIFLAKNVPENTKQFVLDKLEQERVLFSDAFFQALYISSNTLRKPTRPAKWHKPLRQIELPPLKSVCKNREHVTAESDEDLVFYTDQEDVYCFNVHSLYTLFQQDTHPTNPFTGAPFSTAFIQTLLTRYASQPLASSDAASDRSTTGGGGKLKVESLIEQELDRLENALIVNENPELVEQFAQSAIDGHSTLATHPRCFECKKALTNGTGVKSTYKNKVVEFCSYDCLEANNKFD